MWRTSVDSTHTQPQRVAPSQQLCGAGRRASVLVATLLAHKPGTGVMVVVNACGDVCGKYGAGVGGSAGRILDEHFGTVCACVCVLATY